MLMETEPTSSAVAMSPAAPEVEEEVKVRVPEICTEVPASPPPLLIDESRPDPSPSKDDRAPRTPEMRIPSPHMPEIEITPRTPEISVLPMSRLAKCGEKSVIQLGSPSSSPSKASSRPTITPRQLPGYRRSSRNSISEPTVQDVYAFTDNDLEEPKQQPAEKPVQVPESKPEVEPPVISTIPAAASVPQQSIPNAAVTVITSSSPSAPPPVQPLTFPQTIHVQETFDAGRKAQERPAATEDTSEKLLRPPFEQLKVTSISAVTIASPRHSPRAAILPLPLSTKVPESAAPSVLKVELPQIASAVITKESAQVSMLDPVTGLLSPMRRPEESIPAASSVVRNYRPSPAAPHPATGATVTIASPASEMVRHLPPTTVLTPVATKPATLAAYPDVPLTRDVPPAPHQPSILVTQQPAQQHSTPAPLTLPAGVPVSLSGGATVIAVASSSRAAPPPPVTRHTVSGTTVHLTSQPQTLSGTTTIVRPVSTSSAPSTPTTPRLAASTTLVPVPAVQQQPPSSSVRALTGSTTVYSQSQNVQAALPTPRPPPVTPTGTSVSVLPATSRPPSTTGPSSAVSVYPVCGPPTTTLAVTSSSRVTITSSTVARSTPSATPPAQTPYRTVFADPLQHYHGYHGVPTQHSPAASSVRDETPQPREEERTPPAIRSGLIATFPETPIHPHPIHELPTPPPAHQHQHHAWQQQMFLQQMMFRNVQQGALARLAYSPAPGQHPVSETERERERISATLPLHLRNLASGGEHRTTESPLQGSIPMLPSGQNFHRQGSSASAYSSGHLLDRASPSQQPRQTHVPYIPEESGYQSSPPPAHFAGVLRATPNNGPSPAAQPTPASEAPLPLVPAGPSSRPLAIRTPPHASQVPPQADSLVMLLQRYPIMWQGLLALKNDHAVVQMHFISGNPHVARGSLPLNPDGSTLPLRVAQRMRLEQQQLEGVARKMRIEEEHCILLALPCGRDAMDVLQQSNNLGNGFITYLQLKQAAGIVNIAAPGSQQASYVVHIFPSCEFANESLARITPDLLHRVADIAHLLVIIATV